MCNSNQFKERNAAMIRGDVLEAEDGTLTVEIKSTSGRDGTEYAERLTIWHNLDLPKSVKPGKRVEIIAKLDQVGEGPDKLTILQAKSVKPVSKDDGYENFAMLTGLLKFKDVRSAAAGKKPWGYILVALGEKLFRGTIFNQLVPTFQREARRDSVIELAGRLRDREYLTDSGGKSSMLEIIADPDETVIKSVPESKKNMLADMFDDEDEAGELAF